jgi:hypothetical protein
MRKRTLLAASFSLLTVATMAQKNIYRKGWIDFNKNGTRDVYEDPAQPIDRRVADLLSQMTLEEKTCQLATLYGYGRVLKDELPTPAWKNEIWKDGIANIDEHLSSQKEKTAHSYPFRKHSEALSRKHVLVSRLILPMKASTASHTKKQPRCPHPFPSAPPGTGPLSAARVKPWAAKPVPSDIPISMRPFSM